MEAPSSYLLKKSLTTPEGKEQAKKQLVDDPNKARLIYIAGALNAEAISYIINMHKMIKFAKEVREEGYAVFVPCLDFLEGLVDGGMTYDSFFNNGQVVLLRCDAVAVTPGWEASKGTKREIALAIENNIPVFFNTKDLNQFFNR
jgi:hypothetical protein